MIELICVVANIVRNMCTDRFRSILAEARAIHFAMHHGAISYEKAHELTSPLLKEINDYMAKAARKFNQTPRKLVFQDLGRTL